MDNDSVKKNIERIRAGKKLSQNEMAGALGISRNGYRKIEKGETKLISDTIQKIAELAGITPEEVVLGYVPVQDEASVLRDIRERMDNRIAALTEDYESKIERLSSENALLRELNKEKDNHIHFLDARIVMLEKKLEE
ncbi:MAG: helix-turn-helix transcriptional regulator [Bacteroidia bacterium]|nr:helix-turn-helix transcriptional regulator [Bacteroidia bacterium]